MGLVVSRCGPSIITLTVVRSHQSNYDSGHHKKEHCDHMFLGALASTYVSTACDRNTGAGGSGKYGMSMVFDVRLSKSLFRIRKPS
jgi:hypothetical protein